MCVCVCVCARSRLNLVIVAPCFVVACMPVVQFLRGGLSLKIPVKFCRTALGFNLVSTDTRRSQMQADSLLNLYVRERERKRESSHFGSSRNLPPA